MARPPGSRNVSSIDRDAHELRVQTSRVLLQRCSTEQNKKHLRAAVDKLHADAAKGDRGALRMALEIRENMYSIAAADHVARLVGAPDLGDDYTMADAARWIVTTLPRVETTDGMRKFLDLSVRLFQLAAERERVDAMRQAAVPTNQVHALIMAMDLAVQQVLARPELVHLLEVYANKLKNDVIPRFPEVFGFEDSIQSAPQSLS